MTGTAQIDRTALLQKVTISSLLTITERGKVVFDGSAFNVSDSDHSHNAYTQDHLSGILETQNTRKVNVPKKASASKEYAFLSS